MNYGRQWRRLRAAILQHNDTCHICGQPGADTVDHLTPIAAGGAPYDPANLAPAHGARRPGCGGNFGRTPRRPKPNPSRRW